MDGARIEHVEAAALTGRPLRYFDYVMAAFVTILLLSNVLGAGKVALIELPAIGPWPFGAGILFFPVSYVIGDVLTEVYGYARARRVIWAGFVAVLFMALMSWVVVALPPAPDWTPNSTAERSEPRITPNLFLAARSLHRRQSRREKRSFPSDQIGSRPPSDRRPGLRHQDIRNR